MLQRLDSTDEGIAIAGSANEHMHYKFTANLVWGMMLNGTTKENEATRLEQIISASFADLMGAVDRILTTYASSRHLI